MSVLVIKDGREKVGITFYLVQSEFSRKGLKSKVVPSRKLVKVNIMGTTKVKEGKEDGFGT